MDIDIGLVEKTFCLIEKFLFVGNRRFVLDELLKKDVEVKTLVIKNTHLHRNLEKQNKIKFDIIFYDNIKT